VSIWTDKEGNQHVSVMVGGARIHRRLPKGSSARDAKQLEAELRSALGRNRKPVIPGDPPLTEVMGLYLQHAETLRSPETARFHALLLGPWVDGKRASEARQVAAAIIKGLRGHYAPATVNRSLSALQKGLHLAWEAGLTPEDYSQHLKRLPENNARDVHLSIEQVNALAGHASERVRAAIWIALLTGCRRGEIIAIKPEDIGPDSIVIRAGNTKTLKTRIVPIIPALRPWLSALPLGLTAEGLKTGFRRAREAAKMKHVHFHDLRHSCATILLASGADLYTVAKVLGHSTIRMTERYAHHQIDAQRSALDKAFGGMGGGS
jgi:integrase